MVDNQLKANDAKCTKKTFNRLLDLGYEAGESKEMIASIFIEEMYYIMKNNEPFNEKRYAKKLALLPDYVEESEGSSDSTVNLLPVEAAPAVGRNEPCPCGSGKKYKKCCFSS